MNNDRKIHWEFLVAAGILVFTILGVVVPLFVHLDNKFYQLVEHHYQELKEIRERK